MMDWSDEGVINPDTPSNWVVWGLIVPGSVILGVLIIVIVFFACRAIRRRKLNKNLNVSEFSGGNGITVDASKAGKLVF